MKRFIKRYRKPLLALGIFFVVGVQKAYAQFVVLTVIGISAVSLMIPGIRNLLGGLFGGAINDAAFFIVEHAVRFFAWLINAVSGMFFSMANATISFAIDLNDALANKEWIKKSVIGEGYNTMLTVANVGLVISIIVIAFLIMFRVGEDKNKKILVRFIFAAVLINFSFFITTSLIIKPVNSITRNIHRAAEYNIDTFREVFKPSDVNIQTPLRAQLASNARQIAIIEMESKIQEMTYEKLKEAEQRSIDEESSREHTFFYIGGNKDERTIREDLRTDEGYFIDSEVRNGVAQTITTESLFEGFLVRIWEQYEKDGSLTGDDTKRQNLVEFIWDRGIRNPPIAQDYNDYFELYEGGATTNPEGAFRVFADDWIDTVVEMIKTEVVGVDENGEDITLGCNIINRNSTFAECGSFFKDVGVLYGNENRLAQIAVRMGAVLFYATFVVFGSFALFATGLLFIVRYIALGFLIIVSPIVWIGYIFKELEVGKSSIWSVWWKKFTSWVFFGPISMFFFFLAAKAASSLSSNVPIADPEAGTMVAIAEAFGEMLFIIGLLVGGLMVARKFSVEGAENAYKFATGTSKAVGRLSARIVTGGTGNALRAAGGATRETGHAMGNVKLGTKRVRPLRPLGAILKGVGSTMGATGRGIQKAGGGKPRKIRLAGRIRNARANSQTQKQAEEKLIDVKTRHPRLATEGVERALTRIQKGEKLNETREFLQRSYHLSPSDADLAAEQIHTIYEARTAVADKEGWADIWRRPGEVINDVTRDPKLNPLLAAWNGATKSKKKKKKESDDDS